MIVSKKAFKINNNNNNNSNSNNNKLPEGVSTKVGKEVECPYFKKFPNMI